MPESQVARVEPIRAFNFRLEIQGIADGHFTECSGPEVEVGVLKYREAGAGQTVRHLPGQVEYGEIELRYGLTPSTELWSWFQSTVSGSAERRNVSIVMLGNDGIEEVLRWNLLDAWPARWKGVTMRAIGQEMGIESLTLVFDRLERD